MSQAQEKSGYRRRNVYIDKEFQTKFILKFCALKPDNARQKLIFKSKKRDVEIDNCRIGAELGRKIGI